MDNAANERQITFKWIEESNKPVEEPSEEDIN
jgi:hypothetical protein